MYIKIPEKSICSNCGTTNYSETVTRDNMVFKRCRRCGHEKFIKQELPLVSNNNGYVYVLNSKNYNNNIF